MSDQAEARRQRALAYFEAEYLPNNNNVSVENRKINALEYIAHHQAGYEADR